MARTIALFVSLAGISFAAWADDLPKATRSIIQNVPTDVCAACQCCKTEGVADLNVARERLAPQELERNFVAVPKRQFGVPTIDKAATDACHACGNCCDASNKLDWNKFKYDGAIANQVMSGREWELLPNTRK